MDNVIITVRFADGTYEYDFEVSPNVPCSDLAGQIVAAIQVKDLDTGRRISKNPYLSTTDGRCLPDEATLGGAGLLDGSILVLGSDGL